MTHNHQIININTLNIKLRRLITIPALKGLNLLTHSIFTHSFITEALIPSLNMFSI